MVKESFSNKNYAILAFVAEPGELHQVFQKLLLLALPEI